MFTKGVRRRFAHSRVTVSMLPSAEGAEIFVVAFRSPVWSPLGGFTHVGGGLGREALLLSLAGQARVSRTWRFGFFLPTLAGNLFGGTLLFAVLSYAQVREEIE